MKQNFLWLLSRLDLRNLLFPFKIVNMKLTSSVITQVGVRFFISQREVENVNSAQSSNETQKLEFSSAQMLDIIFVVVAIIHEITQILFRR